MTKTLRVGSIEGDKLRLMNTLTVATQRQCGLILLAVQSVIGAQKHCRKYRTFKGTLLH